MTEQDSRPLCAEPRCPDKGERWQDGARWCAAHWLPLAPPIRWSDGAESPRQDGGG